MDWPVLPACDHEHPRGRGDWRGGNSLKLQLNYRDVHLHSQQIHTVDQILTFTSGSGLAQVGGKEREVNAGDLVIVPAGTKHQFLNTGPMPLILYTVYSQAEHKPTTVHRTKEQGDREEDEGIDVPPAWSRRSRDENQKLGVTNGH